MKTIMGIISVGVAHPLYQKEVLLEVLTENTGFNGRSTWVRTAEKHELPHELLVFKGGRYDHTEVLPPTMDYVEGWLERPKKKTVSKGV